uniref:Uncharacterized protein n=1 Tax=Solanum lycopersicum TaxID=4081 RepID=A0A3Q7EEH2_SOLLC
MRPSMSCCFNLVRFDIPSVHFIFYVVSIILFFILPFSFLVERKRKLLENLRRVI